MSNVKSLVLDYGLPGLAMLGAGLMTFMLSGGLEEFPSADPDGGEIQDLDDDFRENNEEFEETLVPLGNADVTPPKWANEVRTITFIIMRMCNYVFMIPVSRLVVDNEQCKDGRGAAITERGQPGSNGSAAKAFYRADTKSHSSLRFL